MKFKMPPIEKIHEAYSAIADNRVEMHDNDALVFSSDRSKTYTVTWNNEVYTSSDNASFWQGYPGYPIIAILMLQGKISLNREIANYFKNINWKSLNTQYKNKYSEVVAFILSELEKQGINVSSINDEINMVYEQIKNLDIVVKRGKIFPPK